MIRVPDAVMKVIITLKDAGHQAFIVGGCVRDQLLGRVPKDWDVATSAHPDEVTQLFEKVIPTGEKFGTVTVVMDDGVFTTPVEVTTFRGDGNYTDGRRPDSVKYVESIEFDLMRRDFTMNAIAFDPVTGNFVDPFGGQQDIERKLICAVGDPAERFCEDALRILRGVRFAAQLGFSIELKTLASMSRYYDRLDNVSAERKGQEMLKTLSGPFVDPALEIGHRLGVTPAYDPMGDRPNRLPLRLAHLMPRDGATALDAYCTSELRLSGDLIREAVALREAYFWLRDARPETDANIRRFLSVCADKNVDFEDVMHLGRHTSESIGKVAIVAATKPPLQIADLDIDGTKVAEILGGPGKQVGMGLRFLRDYVLEFPERNREDFLTAKLLSWAETRS